MSSFPPLPEDTDELLALVGELARKHPEAARQVIKQMLEEDQAALEAGGQPDGE
jgi:ElaB/YqjD/DUF883 family membrane-anchored ribosome-binding protein